MLARLILLKEGSAACTRTLRERAVLLVVAMGEQADVQRAMMKLRVVRVSWGAVCRVCAGV
jgi:hypothetical protein